MIQIIGLRVSEWEVTIYGSSCRLSPDMFVSSERENFFLYLFGVVSEESRLDLGLAKSASQENHLSE
jgi:hypothetical protein